MHTSRTADGFTLLEALVALALVAMIVISYLGVRTTALVDATEARNWRLAQEIGEQVMSELKAGAREDTIESGNEISLEQKYHKGWSYKIVIGEAAVGQIEADLASERGENTAEVNERNQWQQDRDLYRRASEKGLSYQDYQDQLRQQEDERVRQEKAKSETDFEDVAVVVYFPKTRLDQEGKDALVLKAKISSLALSGMTPDQAQQDAESKGVTIQNSNKAPGAPSGPSTPQGGGGGPATPSAGKGGPAGGSKGGSKGMPSMPSSGKGAAPSVQSTSTSRGAPAGGKGR
jgi:prepilin-type N-terminal cleavage/methylation domain-containing protein